MISSRIVKDWILSIKQPGESLLATAVTNIYNIYLFTFGGKDRNKNVHPFTSKSEILHYLSARSYLKLIIQSNIILYTMIMLHNYVNNSVFD